MYTESQIEKLIFNYLSGEATPEDVVALTRWIQESPDHLSRYRQTRNIWQIANPAFDPAEIELGMAHDVVMQQIQPRKPHRSLFLLWQRIAAILLLPTLFLSIYLLAERAGDDTPVSYQEIFAPYGTHSKVNLPDGSVAWLNAGSSLQFPSIFKEGERAVQLDGEAFFEVEADAGNPFIVRAGALSVRATGTAFNVEAYAKDTITWVTMVKGKIDVTISKSQPVTMQPGERMKYNTKQSASQIIKTDPYKWYAWKDGILIFRDDPLDYVFKRIGQTFNVDIVIKDTDIAHHLYRATFEDESLDEILRLLKLTAPIQYKKLERAKSQTDQYDKQCIEVYNE